MDPGLVSLFIGSLLASTLVPGGVEGLLLVMVKEQLHGMAALFLVATIGNILGGIITLLIGALLAGGLRYGRPHPRLERWFSVENKALGRIRRYGTPALLFSWMPVVGDPLCLAAGFLGLRFWQSALMIAAGKAARYLVLLWILQKAV
ncbi:MAG: DedA family protein [Gammaproteobacteria bacterium]|nr:DedA family protein [Gammaproteobacteria bacterium]